MKRLTHTQDSQRLMEFLVAFKTIEMCLAEYAKSQEVV